MGFCKIMGLVEERVCVVSSGRFLSIWPTQVLYGVVRSNIAKVGLHRYFKELF